MVVNLCIVFETIPQSILQTFLLIGIFGNINDTNITASDVYLSIVSAILNSLFQIFRLKLESQACEESFVEYCLTCLMAQIAWIPFHKKIEFILKNSGKQDNSDATTAIATITDVINYDIRYNYPCHINKMIGYQPKINFDFSSLTIQLGVTLYYHIYFVCFIIEMNIQIYCTCVYTL